MLLVLFINSYGKAPQQLIDLTKFLDDNGGEYLLDYASKLDPSKRSELLESIGNAYYRTPPPQTWYHRIWCRFQGKLSANTNAKYSVMVLVAGKHREAIPPLEKWIQEHALIVEDLSYYDSPASLYLWALARLEGIDSYIWIHDLQKNSKTPEAPFFQKAVSRLKMLSWAEYKPLYLPDSVAAIWQDAGIYDSKWLPRFLNAANQSGYEIDCKTKVSIAKGLIALLEGTEDYLQNTFNIWLKETPTDEEIAKRDQAHWLYASASISLNYLTKKHISARIFPQYHENVVGNYGGAEKWRKWFETVGKKELESSGN